MFAFFVRYKFPGEAERDGFYRAVREANVAAISAAEAGCGRYEYFYPCENARELFLFEVWESREQQRVHTQQPHFAALGEIKKRFRAETEIEIMECSPEIKGNR